MSFIRNPFRASLLLITFAIAMLAADANAQESKLGKVDFPTSGPEEAQKHFLRGVAALHSFWYEEALEEFRESTKIAPDFMMGYWGEAMTHNHPIWGDPQETEAARKVLTKIKDAAKLTERERAYLNAVKKLYGDGDKPARDRAYAAAMEKIYHDYPDDQEAALFYALALLGKVRPDDPAALQTRMQAGAIASKVYQKNPDHPGAAHYIIHAFDDPEHAILALPAAQRYAEIAPEAYHALHMPSHIFLQLGMWPEAAASNEAAWEASDKWVKRENLSLGQRDYHSLHWLEYVYLQQGRYDKAEESLALMRESMVKLTDADQRSKLFGAITHASMAGAFIVETERWDLAASLMESPKSPATNGTKKKTHAGHHGGQGADTEVANMASAYMAYAQAQQIFVRVLATAMQGAVEAQKGIAEMRALAKQHADTKATPGMNIPVVLKIYELEISAVAAAAKKNFNEASEMMKMATSQEESLPPPSGPPALIKPSHELFGEILLQAGRLQEAAEQFATALRRQPNRARSLLGAARAAAKNGDTEGARKAYSSFVDQWKDADARLRELKEAQDYLKKS